MWTDQTSKHWISTITYNKTTLSHFPNNRLCTGKSIRKNPNSTTKSQLPQTIEFITSHCAIVILFVIPFLPFPPLSRSPSVFGLHTIERFTMLAALCVCMCACYRTPCLLDKCVWWSWRTPRACVRACPNTRTFDGRKGLTIVFLGTKKEIYLRDWINCCRTKCTAPCWFIIEEKHIQTS